MSRDADSVDGRILRHLDRVRKTGDNRWSARCPAHDDKWPSLSIRLTDDRKILLHCFTGCTTEAICSAIGVSIADLFLDTPQKPSKPITRAQAARAELERRARKVIDAWYDAEVLRVAGDLRYRDRLIEIIENSPRSIAADIFGVYVGYSEQEDYFWRLVNGDPVKLFLEAHPKERRHES
jgi:hypothetical protein